MSRTELLGSIARAARRIEGMRPASGRGVPGYANRLAWAHYDRVADVDELQRICNDLWRIVERLEPPRS